MLGWLLSRQDISSHKNLIWSQCLDAMHNVLNSCQMLHDLISLYFQDLNASYNNTEDASHMCSNRVWWYDTVRAWLFISRVIENGGADDIESMCEASEFIVHCIELLRWRGQFGGLWRVRVFEGSGHWPSVNGL